MFTSTKSEVPCCLCGVKIDPNPSGMCIDCLRGQTDFTQDLRNTSSVIYCRNCGRYQISPTLWQHAELESPELLQICLKRLTGARQLKILDSQFLYTEPHSRRLRVSLTVQKALISGAFLRQTLIVTFRVRLLQCPDCVEAATPREHWVSKVQIRQDSLHKRTLFWLEQTILSHRAHEHVMTIARKHGGMDFHFSDKPSGQRFANFLKAQLPVEVKQSAKQVSEDLQCGTLDMRFSFSVRVPPLNRQELIALSPRLIRRTGGQSVVAVVHRISKKIKLIDPASAKMISVDGTNYWERPFQAALSLSSLTRFIVISIEPVGPQLGKFQCADVELVDEETYADQVIVRSHLGGELHEGEPCVGYDLRTAILPDDLQVAFAKQKVPDVVIVGRCQAADSRRQRRRAWHVRELAPRDDAEQAEFDEFLDDLESDADLRKGINIYRNTDAPGDPSALDPSEMKPDDGSGRYVYRPDSS
jgi:nonsense-mediated mRNA decay protein 3